MSTKELYRLAMEATGNRLMRLPRHIHFFLARPFYKKLLVFQDTIRRSLTKDLNAQESLIKEILAEDRSRQKDFDAIFHRMGFIEGSLRKFDLRITEIIEKTLTSDRVSLGESIHEINIPQVPVTIHHGRFGNFVMRTPDLIGDHIRGGGFWDEHLHDLIIRHSDMDGVAIDAGAYFGFHSCFMARYFSKVIAFEPQILMCHMFAANIVLNGLENVEIHNCALYDHECRMRVAAGDKQEIPVVMKNGKLDYSKLDNAAAITFELASPIKESIRSIPLDQMKLDNVKFIKIDTQGSDLRILLGARETIRRCRPIIVFEYETKLSELHGSAMVEYEKFFSEERYQIRLLSSNEDKQYDYCATPI